MSKSSNRTISSGLFDLVFRTPYDGLSDQVSLETGVVFPDREDEPFSAVQGDADSCDLNLIVARQDVAAVDRFESRRTSGVYADLASQPDFERSMAIILEANAAFADLPASARKEFDNDPAQLLLAFDQGDEDRLRRAGLLEASPEPVVGSVEPSKVSADGVAKPPKQRSDEPVEGDKPSS